MSRELDVARADVLLLRSAMRAAEAQLARHPTPVPLEVLTARSTLSIGLARTDNYAPNAHEKDPAHDPKP